jgi:predicted nucleotidyltransferase
VRLLVILFSEMYISVMRTVIPSALPLFRSELQLRILAHIFEEGAPVAARDLVESLQAPPASVHRELTRARAAGIIVREAVGRTQLYTPATDSPLYEPLRDLLKKTVGVDAELQAALAEEPNVVAAAVHGSYARGTGVRPQSDIDLLVIGDVDYRRLRKRLRDVERHTGRRVDPVIYSTDEARTLYRAGNGFIKGVLEGPRIDIVGNVADVIAP